MPVERQRGRKAVEIRKRRLALHPICAHCFERGIIRETDEIDHIVPLSMDGTDEDSNTQGLCLACHATKSATEGSQGAAVAKHPTWFKSSAIPLTIVTGPPASGKTTYVRERAQPGDIIIDLDEIVLRQTGKHGHDHKGFDHIGPAMRERNAIIGSLHKQRQGRAWLIVGAPTKAERRWWHKTLGGELIHLDPGKAECMRRVKAERLPRFVAAVTRYYEREVMAWTAPEDRPKVRETGLDGWPVA